MSCIKTWMSKKAMGKVVLLLNGSNRSGFVDLKYMAYFLQGHAINFPRLILKHMTYLINTSSHELPYGDLLMLVFKVFNVPLQHKEAKTVIEMDYFRSSLLSKCGLNRIDGVWWLGSGENKRRDLTESDSEKTQTDLAIDDDTEDDIQEGSSQVPEEPIPAVIEPIVDNADPTEHVMSTTNPDQLHEVVNQEVVNDEEVVDQEV